MRFKLDENPPLIVGQLLRAADFDVETVQDESLAGFPDSDIYAACQREGRALVTLDLDFADVRAYPPAESPGVVVLRSKSQDIDILRLQSASRQLWIVTEHRVRMRL